MVENVFFFFFLTKLISYILFKIVCVFHLTLLTSFNIREEEKMNLAIFW